MRESLRTAVIASASSLTTGLLVMACSAGTTNPAATPPGTSPPAAVGSPRTSTGTDIPRSASISVAQAQPGAPIQQQPAGASASSPASQVYQSTGASVVNITSLAVVRNFRGTTTQPQGTGSGFIIDNEGRIVTNNHVVQDADQLTVTFPDRTTVPARLVARDPDNDLAVVQVDASGSDEEGRPMRDRLKPATLGDSNRLTVGELAIAIGSPLGLQQTVTQGIVSALRNPGEGTARGGIDLLGGAVQTDASINPGNSGGPLFNVAGEVIGVNTAILSQSGGNEGIGFAIPINVVKRVVPVLIQNGRYPHPLIGVSSTSLALLGSGLKQQLGIPANLKGLLVQESTAGASEAGIRGGNRSVTASGEQIAVGGDIIVAVDSQPVSSGGELRGYVENNKRPGERVTLTIVRNGQRQDIAVTLSEKPDDTAPAPAG